MESRKNLVKFLDNQIKLHNVIWPLQNVMSSCSVSETGPFKIRTFFCVHSILSILYLIDIEIII